MVTLLVISLLAVASFTDAVSVGGVCDSAATCSDTNSYCHMYGGCSKGYCFCKSGYGYNLTSCVPEVLLGASCTSYCTAGTCTGGTCQCSSGLTASSDKRQCVGKDLGGSCTVTSNCQAVSEGLLANSVTCLSNKCSCITGWKSFDNEVCVWADDGASCTSSNDCYPGIASNDAATCSSSKCTCPTVSGTKYVWKQVYIGSGRTVGACVHPSAQEVGNGQTCTSLTVNDATARYCSAGNVCTRCPENIGTTKTQCISDAAGNIRASLLLALLLGAFVALFN